MKQTIRRNPGFVSVVITLFGYLLVMGTLYGDWLDLLYPRLSLETVNLLSHLIAANNTLAVAVLGLGWFWIRRGRPRKHRLAMLLGFGLILVFLVMYLLKTGGGGRKEFVGPQAVRIGYLLMLLVHILLSILSVPLVVYVLTLGLSRPIDDVPETRHATVGRWAAGCWIVSLVLGVACYVLLNHAYAYEFVR